MNREEIGEYLDAMHRLEYRWESEPETNGLRLVADVPQWMVERWGSETIQDHIEHMARSALRTLEDL